MHTFVICAYKESPYLGECISSLLKQTVKSRILIVTSTPNEYITRTAAEYELPVIVNKGQGGIVQDWNFAYKQADTPYVTIAHQDDVYFPDYTEQMLRQMRKEKRPLIWFSDYAEIRNGQIVKNNKLLHIKRMMLLPLRIKGFWKSRFIRRRVLSFGCPICCPSVAFAKDNKRLAVACLVAQGGSLQTNLYFLDIRSDEVTASATASGQPLQLHWLSNDRLLAVYDRMAAVYDAATGEQTAVYSFEGESLGAASVSGQNCALLFSPEASDSPARLVVLDPQMQVLGEASVPAPAEGVVCTRTAAYVLRQESVAAYSLAGEALWEAPTETRPLAVLDAKQLVVVTGGQAALLTQPDDGQTA